MRLLKPSWLHHDDNLIFSIDIHPDDSRVVTGGQGNDSVGRVVIWNMEPILSKDEDLSVPKLLCQLDHHNACVNCVRWSNSGKYLCSGGDDRVIIIWKLVSKYNPKLNSSSVQNSAFGKTNLEQWKTLSMLRGHTGDILDLAWSPEDLYLASASVDNTVIIWDATNFPQIVTTLRGHNSLVKGVTWDPVGKYLASQSDDKTLKVWRVSDWGLEQCIQDPFLECGGTTYVLRLDWAPDGSHLVSAHAMNGGGPTAQIIERSEWKTDKDFVGHRKAVVCVKFNGNILQSNNSRIKHCCVALGSRDKSVSIWSTSMKRPLVVIKDLFTKSVMDLSWSSCGRVMMACSWDGTVAVAKFSWEEIGKPLSSEEKNNFYHKMYGKSVSSSENCDIIQNLDVFLAKRNAADDSKKANHSENVSPPAAESNNRTHPTPEIIPPSPSTPSKGPSQQIETRMPDGRRRITPKFLLPPSDAEQETSPQSEQTVFMQGKGKEDATKTVQDWRKSMVSSLENVKGFTETAKSSTSKEPVDEAGKPPENNNNNDDEVELMEVEEVSVNKGKGTSAGSKASKMVNGNGPVRMGEAAVEERQKTDDDDDDVEDTGRPTNHSTTTTKEKLVNGDSHAKTGVPSPTAATKESGASKSKNGVLVNGMEIDKELVRAIAKEKSPVVTTTKPDETVSASSSTTAGTSSKKDQLPAPAPAQNKDGVSMIAVRKKKSAPEEPLKPVKKVKLVTPGGSTGESADAPTTKPALSSSTPHAIIGSSLVIPPQRSLGGSSPSKAESSKGHYRLPPMKIESVLNLAVSSSPSCSYALQVANNYKRSDGICHQLLCAHSRPSLNELEWTICTDAPICGVSGDGHRIVLLCENCTVHVLDTKGRYAFPPVVLSGYPSKSLQSGAILVVITTKATIHIWNIHTKRVVLKSESLLPLLNQSESEKDRPLDITRIQVAAGGLPIIVLNTGKTFMYSFELCSWFLISDPRGPVSSPLTSSISDRSLASRMMLFAGDEKLRKKPEPAIVTHIKLKLATSTEMRNPDQVRQWMIALAKSLANHGLKKELNQLCLDLLGPTHSSADSSTQWIPTLIGVIKKRELLRKILTLLLEDLRYQDFYSEFDEQLREVEAKQNDTAPLTQPATSNHAPTN